MPGQCPSVLSTTASPGPDTYWRPRLAQHWPVRAIPRVGTACPDPGGTEPRAGAFPAPRRGPVGPPSTVVEGLEQTGPLGHARSAVSSTHGGEDAPRGPAAAILSQPGLPR